MAAKTAGTWAPYQPAGIAPLTNIDTTQVYDLGLRCKAKDQGTTGYGFGEFIYLKGVASTARGSVVLIKDDYSTSLVTARDKGALAVALGAVDSTSKYGWYQILGKAVVACDTTAANTPLYIDGTDGRVDDAAVAGDQIIGARAVTADDTNTLVANLSTYPATADYDNA